MTNHWLENGNVSLSHSSDNYNEGNSIETNQTKVAESLLF